MGYFEWYFSRHGGLREPNSSNEIEVHCPFHDDRRPSAHVNLVKRVFHCKACATNDVGGGSEAWFMSKIEGISIREAYQLLNRMQKSNDGSSWNAAFENYMSDENWRQAREAVMKVLRINEETMRKLKIRGTAEEIRFPVFIHGELFDVRTYRPNGSPKVVSQQGATQAIWPFDLWDRNTPVLLCAGEKDTTRAIHHGFNAITFTGGETSFPKLFKNLFKNQVVYIMYDNDDAGRKGARKVAFKLKEAGAFPYIIEQHHQLLPEKGDLFDLFDLKGDEAVELVHKWMEEAQPFDEEMYEEEREKQYPTVSIEKALSGELFGKVISSKVQVVVEDGQPFLVPGYAKIEVFEDNKISGWKLVQQKEWVLDDGNIEEALRLFEDKTISDEKVRNEIIKLAGIHIPKRRNQHDPERIVNVHIRENDRIPFYRAVVTDDRETERIDDEHRARELTVYVRGQALDSAERYRIFYKVVHHPRGQGGVGVVLRAEKASSSVSRFKVTPKIMETLTVFQGKPDEKMDELYERFKALYGPDLKKDVFFATELTLHSVQQFQFPIKGTLRGTLDVMLIGDPRTGKSSVYERAMEVYGLGTFVNLRNATIQGLIGGSDKGDNYRIRMGTLPRNHGGAVCLEEFSGESGRRFIRAMTDIRTRGVVSIDRVRGKKTVPCRVRMLTISNPESDRRIREHAHGAEVVQQLIGSSPDIARYDFFVLVPEVQSEEEIVSALDYHGPEAFPPEAYRNRIRWVWSRKPEQIEISGEVAKLLEKGGKWLFKKFRCRHNFFPAGEAWLKLARVSLAVAACLVSTDETGEKLILKDEHVRWALRFLKNCYDNDVFKLKQYIAEERLYDTWDSADVAYLQKIHSRKPMLVKYLKNHSIVPLSQLKAASGCSDRDEFDELLGLLVRGYFVVISDNKVGTTSRFNACVKLVKDPYLKQIGERA